LKNPLFYFVVGNYCSYKEISSFIKSLNKIKYDNYKILIVDDGSPDNSYYKLQQEFPLLDYIKSKKNKGYCSTFNMGCKEAFSNGANYVFWAQNDSIDYTPNIVNAIVEKFENDVLIGVIGTKIYDGDGGIRWDHNLVDRLGVKFNISEGFAISKKAFDETGGMDEKLVVYFEDIDLVCRMRILGFKTFVINNESWVHIGGKTYSKLIYKKNYFRVRNKFIILGRYVRYKKLTWYIKIILGETKQHLILFIDLLKYFKFIKAFTVITATLLGTLSGTFLFFKERCLTSHNK